ncbi:MAG TPA: GNAT family N-acetyltransferase [Burkholderiales bacterium]|nr:GNAT family N-acetyltransferase [Burkholderiales bacterium]
MALTASPTGASLKARRLAPDDLEAIVAIDARHFGRTRRAYFERRLRAAEVQPALHVQFGVDDRGELAGCVLARRLAGEFGLREPALRLEAIGVRQDEQSHGVGHELMRALEAAARADGIGSIRTTAAWRDHRILHFLDAAGFELGGNQVLQCSVHAGRLGAEHAPDVEAPDHRNLARELDYSGNASNDFDALARDRADVRILARDDVSDMCRIDRRITGRDRREYIGRLVDEALDDSAVRVSLTARVDAIVAGFVTARTDFGDFGRTDPVAVLDTIGVDPDYAHRGVGTALLSQLFVNLQGLRIERVETSVGRENFALLGFLYAVGFEPSQRLSFVKRLS